MFAFHSSVSRTNFWGYLYFLLGKYAFCISSKYSMPLQEL